MRTGADRSVGVHAPPPFRHACTIVRRLRVPDAGSMCDKASGLGPALGSLLETVRRRTTLKAADLPRFPARVEDGVHFCLATLLRGWPDGRTRVLISVSARDGRLGVVLFDPETTDIAHIATAAGWEAVAGRIAALKGTVASGPNFGGLIITIDIPVAGRNAAL